MNMKRDHPSPRSLVSAMRDLSAIEPPASLLPAILRLTDLADTFLPLETSVGNIFVAWSSRGITAVMRREDAAMFARDFTTQYQRRVIESDTRTASALRPE
jgi:hypothetical protein